MRLSDLQSKKVIDVTSGSNVGNIIDVDVSDDGSINSLILDSGKSFFSFRQESDFEILWKQITKIGEDVILVKKEWYK